MKANQAELPVRAMCKTLRVSHSGYYDWLERPACARAQANVALLEQIRQAHAASDATYGVPRIQAELADQGIKAGHNRIASVMRANGLRGVSLQLRAGELLDAAGGACPQSAPRGGVRPPIWCNASSPPPPSTSCGWPT